MHVVIDVLVGFRKGQGTHKKHSGKVMALAL